VFYFNVIFDELFSNYNIIFFSTKYFEIDLSSVATGVYYIKFYDNNTLVRTQKLVVN
jgi:hypothetical protein